MLLEHKQDEKRPRLKQGWVTIGCKELFVFWSVVSGVNALIISFSMQFNPLGVIYTSHRLNGRAVRVG